MASTTVLQIPRMLFKQWFSSVCGTIYTVSTPLVHTYLLKTHLQFNSHFPGEARFHNSSSVLFFHLSTKKTFEYKSHSFFMAAYAFCHSTINVKALIPTTGLASLVLHPPPDSRLLMEGILLPSCQLHVANTITY